MRTVIHQSLNEVRNVLLHVREVCHTGPILAASLTQTESALAIVDMYASELDALAQDALDHLNLIEARLGAPNSEAI